MRSVLILGLLLLALTALWRWKSDFSGDDARQLSGPRPGLNVYSTGLGLRPTTDVRPPGLTAFALGDLWFHDPMDRDALGVLALTPGGGFLEHATFALRDEPAAVSDLEAFVSRQASGALLAMAVRGSIQPVGSLAAERTEDIAALLSNLGARFSPQKDPSVSWIFLVHRSAEGWQPLAESHSTVRGINLALPLGNERVERMLRDGRPLLARDALQGRTISLGNAPLGRGAFVRRAQLPRGVMDALRLRPAKGNRVLGPLQVRVGRRPGFQCSLALDFGAYSRSNGVRLELWIDGAKTAERIVKRTASARPEWSPWSVDLDGLDGGDFSLELRLNPLGSPAGDVLLCGAPLVVWYE